MLHIIERVIKLFGKKNTYKYSKYFSNEKSICFLVQGKDYEELLAIQGRLRKSVFKKIKKINLYNFDSNRCTSEVIIPSSIDSLIRGNSRSNFPETDYVLTFEEVELKKTHSLGNLVFWETLDTNLNPVLYDKFNSSINLNSDFFYEDPSTLLRLGMESFPKINWEILHKIEVKRLENSLFQSDFFYRSLDFDDFLNSKSDIRTKEKIFLSIITEEPTVPEFVKTLCRGSFRFLRPFTIYSTPGVSGVPRLYETFYPRFFSELLEFFKVYEYGENIAGKDNKCICYGIFEIGGIKNKYPEAKLDYIILLLDHITKRSRGSFDKNGNFSYIISSSSYYGPPYPQKELSIYHLNKEIDYLKKEIILNYNRLEEFLMLSGEVIIDPEVSPKK